MTNTKTLILAAVFAALAGYCAYATIALEYLANAQSIATATEIVNTASFFTYGTIVSVDAPRHSLTFSYRNPTTGDIKSIAMLVTDQTVIEREDLVADASGTYVSISPLTPGTIDDLTTGTLAAIGFVRSGDRFEATEIRYGNPL